MEVTVQQCCDILGKMDDIVILCHRNPDGDTLGAGFALYYILAQLGKRSRIECHDEIPAQYSYMLLDYKKEDFEPKAVVAVDIADEQLFGDNLEKYRGKVDLCIDHHGSNKLYAKNWIVRDTAAATCEVIEDICYGFEEVQLTKLIADCIYTGVSTDTGCFRYSNTTGHTHAVAGRMFKAGCDFVMINRAMFEVKSFSRIALEKEVLNTIEFHFDKRCALAYITKDMLERTGAIEAELEGVAAMPREIEGVEIGLTLRQRGNGYKISVRTGEGVDASVLCGKLGGGGHRCAAGCFVEGNLEHAKEVILKTAEESFKEESE
ncbi:MAG: bifunctional oligoribonuclease/PAP phosphatase NrnA [Oscillospiraceae bacterium]|nr:bifunctional oligoribonuclease/PAP phosphatase NrnA [Oscillospiraceae bacterium]MBQ3236763.1 bifunctional oligoribonuclease/PAP phosphatase NrnA [Oscillospiraceae bacterium]